MGLLLACYRLHHVIDLSDICPLLIQTSWHFVTECGVMLKLPDIICTEATYRELPAQNIHF